MTEADLAAAVSAWLRSDGWRTFHEVPMGCGRADIVAVRGGALVWVVETKLRGGIDVLEQALERRWCGASAVLVATPRARSGAFGRVAHQLGIGVIEVNDLNEPRLAAWPEYHRHARARDLVRRLAPEQEVQVAGKAGGSYWTPFKSFVRDFVEFMSRSSGPMPLADAAQADAIKRSRASSSSPRASSAAAAWPTRSGGAARATGSSRPPTARSWRATSRASIELPRWRPSTRSELDP